MKQLIFILFIAILSFGPSKSYGQEYIGIFSNQNSTLKETPGPAYTVADVAMVKSSDRTDPNVGPLSVTASYTQNLFQITDIGATHNALMFGAQSSNTKTLGIKPLLVTLQDVGNPSDSYYSALPGGPTLSIFSTNAFEQYASVEQFQDDNGPKMSFPTLGEYKMGEITYTFSRVVENPVLHITGLGGIFGSTEFGVCLFSVKYKLVTGGDAIGLTPLSGTSRLVVDVNEGEIYNNFSQADYDMPNSTSQGVSGDDAGTGSIQVNGIINSVTFEIYMEGKTPLDNGISSNWTSVPADGANQRYSGDRFNTSWSLLPSSVLPITLASLERTFDSECNVRINWATQIEENASHFDVEVSNDGAGFNRVGSLKSLGSGNNYSYNLDGNLGYKYARLKMVDLDGRVKYSEILNINGNCTNAAGVLSLFPNPIQINSKLNIKYKANEGRSTFQIIDLQGKLVSTQSFNTNSKGVNNLQLDVEGLEAGLYMIISPEGAANRIIVTR